MKLELPYASNKEIADEKIGKWLSAALEDPTTCGAMKDDINEWFQAIEEERLRSKKKQINDELSDLVKMVMGPSVECCDGGGPVGAGCYHDHCTGPKTKTKGKEQ